MTDLVAELKALDAELDSAKARLDAEHRTRKARLMARLVAEAGSVSEACRMLGITRARWYQIVEKMGPTFVLAFVELEATDPPNPDSSQGAYQINESTWSPKPLVEAPVIVSEPVEEPVRVFHRW